jgi:ribose/xylose/arabinose/galactoside ABC-type transport system permease subunit
MPQTMERLSGEHCLQGSGNVIGTLFGVLSQGTVNNIVVALRLEGPDITTGIMLCFFIVLQSIILGYRHSRISGEGQGKAEKQIASGKL